jgi:hypothetical protein
MKVDLNPLPYTLARNIINWCWEHNIDKDKCAELIQAMTSVGNKTVENEWVLEIPDKYVTFFMLKWSYDVVTEY